ncbi:MAG: PhnE/PtxC family ABC transporter permease [Campylobacterota bacterium]
MPLTQTYAHKRPWSAWAFLIIIAVLIVGAFVSVEWDFTALSDADQRQKAFARMLAWLSAFLTPDLSKDFLAHAWALTLQTLSAAILATLLSIFAALFLAMLSSKSVIVGEDRSLFSYLYKAICAAARILQDILRAVPDFVWAVILVAVIGLGPLTGALALALSMTGILAKVYSELWDNVEPKSYESVQLLGGGKIATLLYAIAPLSARSVQSFTLMRAECAIRNAAVIGAVGGGGLGSDIWYQIQFGAWEKVTTLILFTLALTLTADLVSNFIRRQLRSDPNHPKAKQNDSVIKELSRSYVAVFVAFFIAIWSVWFMGWGNNTPPNQPNQNYLKPVGELLVGKSWENLGFFSRMLSPEIDKEGFEKIELFSQYKAYEIFNLQAWRHWDSELENWFIYKVVKSSSVVLAMAIVGTVAGFLIALILAYAHSVSFMLESHHFSGEKIPWYLKISQALQLILAKLSGLVFRGIPEVMWAFLFISFFGPGILAATVAIALHSAGVLVRVFSESIDNIPYKKFEQHYRGSKLKCFFLVAVPIAWRDWMTYSFFQFESNLRMAVVLGIVGAGGLGFYFNFHFEWFMFEKAASYLLMIIALTVIVDRISRALKLSRIG